jgi:hypothetical protein
MFALSWGIEALNVALLYSTVTHLNTEVEPTGACLIFMLGSLITVSSEVLAVTGYELSDGSPDYTIQFGFLTAFNTAFAIINTAGLLMQLTKGPRSPQRASQASSGPSVYLYSSGATVGLAGRF